MPSRSRVPTTFSETLSKEALLLLFPTWKTIKKIRRAATMAMRMIVNTETDFLFIFCHLRDHINGPVFIKGLLHMDAIYIIKVAVSFHIFCNINIRYPAIFTVLADGVVPVRDIPPFFRT